MDRLGELLADERARLRVEAGWKSISEAFDIAAGKLPAPFMARTEISFHDQVRLLGFVCLATRSVKGDIVEIGVWKGKSLAFMRELAGNDCRVVGIDPCALDGQPQEVDYYRSAIYPTCDIVKEFSQDAIARIAAITKEVKLLHIDGGHSANNVWMDFLIYDHLVVPNGYVVFDDYGDDIDSPEVRGAVDQLNAFGFFARYEILGRLPGFENSFVLLKR